MAAAAGAYWLGDSRVGGPSNAGLRIDQAQLDFGTAWEDERFTWNLSVRNSARAAVDVNDFATTCACLAVEPRSFTLGLAESRDIDLKLDLGRGPGEKRSDAEWPFEVGLVPELTGQPVHQQGWIVRGRVRKLLDISPRVLSFLDGEVGAPFASREVKILTRVPVDKLQASCDPSMSVRINRVGPKEFVLQIQPKPKVSAGIFKGTVWLQAHMSDTRQVPSSSVSFQGMVHAEVIAVPGAIAVGALPTGSTFSEAVCLRSRSSLPFFVEKWNTNSPETRVEHLKMSQGGPCFRIMHQIKTGGPGKCCVVFAVRLSNERRISVPVDVVYHGYKGTELEVKGQD